MSEDTEPQKSRNWRGYLLVASLGLNLLLIGLIGGAVIKGGPKGREAAGVNMRHVIGALPKEQRKALRQSFASNRAQLKAGRNAMHEHHAKIVAAIKAVPYDRTVLEAAYDKHAELLFAVSQSSRKALVDMISDMSDEQRAEFAQNLESMKHKKRRNKRKD